MDYEKLHKDTIAKLQEMVNSGKITVKTACGICADFVPESEDERIRKFIIEIFKESQRDGVSQAIMPEQYDKIFAWLEKQGEQKSAWSEEDGKMARFIGNAITADDASTYLKDKGIEVIDAHVWLESLKDRVLPQPKHEWSEEDKEMLERCCGAVAAADYYTYDDKQEMESWLKSLRPQSQWKPSDEQIKAVRLARSFVTDDFDEHPALSEILIELEKQLKKLREE